MTAADVGRVRFFDGMRVTREHLEHLQEVSLVAASQAREADGPGKVAHGLRVQAAAPTTVTVGPGLAVDRRGRPLALDAARDVAVDFGAATTVFVVVQHVLRSEGVIEGVPTMLFDDVAIKVRPGVPPYDDDAVVFARLDTNAGAIRVTQLGDWYLPPLDHRHSGLFVERDGRWRFDGEAPLGGRGEAPAFDSGFVAVSSGAAASLAHGLGTADLEVQLQARRDGVVTVAGIGQVFWYELAGNSVVRLVHEGGRDAAPLDLRVVLWPLGPAPEPVAPLADAGDGQIVEPGRSFTLDGGRSRAFGGRRVTTYTWTQTS